MNCLQRTDSKTLFETLKSQFSTTVLGGGKIIDGSPEWFATLFQAQAAEWFQSIAEQNFRELSPETMCDDNFITYFSMLGIYPKPAAFARGYVRLTGTVGANIPLNLQVDFNGSIYIIDPLSSPSSKIGADSKAVVMMQAVSPGASGNATGAAGSLTTAINGIDSSVASYGAAFCAGGDAETMKSFRSRALDRLKSPPIDDWRWLEKKALEWPCLTRICRSLTGCCNDGRIEAFVFFDGSFDNGIAPQHIVDDVSRWLFGSNIGAGDGQARIGLFGRLLSAEPVPIDIVISNLTGISTAQWLEIKSQFSAILSNRCPGETICQKWFEAVIVSQAPRNCDFTLTLSDPSNRSIPCNGNITPQYNQLPIMGEIYGGPEAPCTQ